MLDEIRRGDRRVGGLRRDPESCQCTRAWKSWAPAWCSGSPCYNAAPANLHTMVEIRGDGPDRVRRVGRCRLGELGAARRARQGRHRARRRPSGRDLRPDRALEGAPEERRVRRHHGRQRQARLPCRRHAGSRGRPRRSTSTRTCGLLVRTETTVNSAAGAVPVVAEPGDFRKVDGITGGVHEPHER
ncbi:MAG: hypothetical protein MZV64_43210 [Ignavibacteriales bacterium]|nr:hypothetical protein [Ignavibacteriales bacterium]